jgi:hypothetical protein
MYLGVVLIGLAVLFAFAGIFSGGVFTIVLVPLAVIGMVAAVVALMSARVTLLSARAAGITPTLTQQPGPMPKGRVKAGSEPPPGEVPVTPDEYVEARQKSQ